MIQVIEIEQEVAIWTEPYRDTSKEQRLCVFYNRSEAQLRGIVKQDKKICFKRARLGAQVKPKKDYEAKKLLCEQTCIV